MPDKITVTFDKTKYKLVPLEASYEMCSFPEVKVGLPNYHGYQDEVTWVECSNIYRPMVLAAPPLSELDDDVEVVE